MRAKQASPKLKQMAARRARVAGRIRSSTRTRLTVYRSAKHIYALLVDSETGRTIASVSTRTKAVTEGLASTGNVEAAKRVGKAVAALAREKQIDAVVFNRNGFLYHGRVKALADAAREAGLQF
jgi:large subunit ribosomal protein L18